MKPLKIYTTTYCPYCSSAKRLFTQLNLPFEEVNLDDKEELRSQLSKANGGWRTVPMIFVGDQFLGGFQDVQALHQRGEFLNMVQGA